MIDIGRIIDLAKAIYEQVETVQSNQAQCKTLAARVKLVEDSLDALRARPETPRIQKAVHHLTTCVEKCFVFVKQFCDTTWYHRLRNFAQAKGIQNEFGKLSQQLGQACTQLQLDINIAQLVNHDQDQRDRHADQTVLLEKLDEIVQINQQELIALDLMSTDAKAHHDETQEEQAVIQKQIESLSQHIQDALQAKPHKALIDRHLNIPFYETGQFEEVLGKGAYATIYRHRWCEQPIAVKLIAHKLSEAELKKFSNEIKVTSRLRNAHIVQLYGACLERDRAALMMEYLPGGTLQARLESDNSLTAHQKHTIALSVARGLCYAHRQGVLHRTLKDDNILLTAQDQAKLTGFGLAKVRTMSSVHSLEVTHAQTEALCWQSPQTLDVGHNYTEQDDIYSYGVVLWVLMTEKRPYRDLAPNAIIIRQAIKSGQRPGALDGIPAPYQTLIMACWQRQPERRPSLSAVIKHLEQHAPALSVEILGQPEAVVIEAVYQQAKVLSSQKQYDKAFALFLQAAKWGCAPAQVSVGTCFMNGWGVSADKQQGHSWYLAAAQQGEVKGQYYVGKTYIDGKGVKRDINQASMWYQRAAGGGHQRAQEKYQALQLEFKRNI